MSLSRWSYWSQVIVQRLTLALLVSLGAAGGLWSFLRQQVWHPGFSSRLALADRPPSTQESRSS